MNSPLPPQNQHDQHDPFAGDSDDSSVSSSEAEFNSDSDEEEPEPEPVLSENMILQIKNNDPNLVNLTIDMVENGLDNSSTDWAQLGTDIGNHTHLNQLDINGIKMQEIWDDIEMSQKFMRGLTSCKSITQLTLEDVKIPSMHTNSSLDSMHNLRKLELLTSHIGEGYAALGKLLKNPESKLHELKIVTGDLFIDASNILRDSLENNTTLKKLHIQFHSANGIQVAWACRNSAIEELALVDSDRSCEKELMRVGEVLKGNTTLKTLKLKFGEATTTTGWESFNVALRNNTTLTELDLSDNMNFNNEAIQNFATVLSNNSTLKTLRLENLRHVTRDGWRSIPTLYLRSPTCQLESLYMGQNVLDGGTFRELGSSCWRNKTLRNLCLRLPTTARGINTPRVGWNPWMNQLTRIVYNKRSIIETFNSNHMLETICYPHDESRLARDMMTCPLMGKNLPTYLLMNRREQDKSLLARKKIMEAHYLNQDVITDNRRYRGYKSLMETILESTDNMERTERLPLFMSWILRDNDGLQLMYEFLHMMPSLCENIGTRAHDVVPPAEEVPASKKQRSE